MNELRRILYVEDDLDIQLIGRMALERIGGFWVRCCDSGVEALVAAPEFRPQLVLLDVMMPNLDGLATFRALRETSETARTPIVFMTAKVQPREVAELRRLGALDVVAKPFDPMTLSARLRTLWQVSGS